MTKEYEIVPKKEVGELKKEIQELKSYLHMNKSEEGDTLLGAIKELTAVFKEAVEELKGGKESSGALGGNVKMDVLISQNEKIARGILALADMVQENLPKLASVITRMPKVKYIRIPVPQTNQKQQYRQPYQQPQQQPLQYPPQRTPSETQPIIPQPPQKYGRIPKLNPKEIPKHDIKF